ncbi:MAG: neutral zinc metallopeptidase [Bacteroidales bacterium]|jgi:predicted metalloprotease|nr:neutral zinc metallopeptidase [Bacteroidales bacterium]
MRLEGRRESTNVEDRRGMSGGAIAGGLGGGAIIIALIVMLLGGDPTSVLQQAGSMQPTEQTTEVTFSEEEQELASFAKKILAGTEDIWTAQFAKYGYQYQAPKMVLYTGTTSSGCGTANSQVGPFYCSADQTVYLDLSFLSTMRQQIGADGDLAYAYVIAHEVGHHVEYLLGTLGKAHQKMSQSSKAVANQWSVRLELLADYYAGVWANNDNARFRSIEPGDIERALDCASKIGDDYLQKKSQGYVVSESFTHGTAQQRYNWLKKGMTYGDLEHGNTFEIDYNRL